MTPSRPTLRDVAARAGVSLSSASRALGDGPVSIVKKAKVLRAAADLGYVVNLAARSLKKDRSMSMGFFLRKLSNASNISMLETLAEELGTDGYTLLVSMRRDDVQADSSLLCFLERAVDALFLAYPVGVGKAVEPLLRAGVPVLALVARGRDCENLPLVTPSMLHTLTEAMDEIVALGHRRLMLVTPPPFAGPTELFTKAIGKRDVELLIHKIEIEPPHDDLEQWAQECAARIVQDPDRPTIVFATAGFAPVLRHALEQAGLAVPDDISICSLLEDSYWEPTGFTGLRLDAVEFGKAAAMVMLDWLDGIEPDPITRVDATTWVEAGTLAAAPPAESPQKRASRAAG